MVSQALEQKSWASLRCDQPQSCDTLELITMPEEDHHLNWVPVSLTQATWLAQNEEGMQETSYGIHRLGGRWMSHGAPSFHALLTGVSSPSFWKV